MPRDSLATVVEARLDETAGGRYLDVCMDLMRCECPRCQRGKVARELLCAVGGRWDRAAKVYAGAAETSRRVTLQAAQLPVARWFASWMRARRGGDHVLGPNGKPCYTLAMVGGRRGGKSDASVKFPLAYLLDTPRSIAWLVVPEYGDSPEIERAIEEQLPAAWYRRVALTWTLVNGSVLEIRSSYDPDALKRGRCDIAVIHEAQKHEEKAYVVAAPAAADRGGLVILAANPPDTARGEWVSDLVDRSRAGKTDEVVFEVDPRLNPHVEHEALEALKAKMDERTYQREILGQFLPRTDTVFYAFSPSPLHGNVRPTGRGENGEPLVEVTRTFLSRKLGCAADRLHGMDFQRTPMVAVTMRFFEDPTDPRGDPLIWYSGSVQLEQASEDDLLDALEARGYSGADPCVIDASGEWQDSERKKGRNSADVLRRRGWRKIYLPDAGSRKNPPVLERVAVMNALFKNALGRRKAFVDPSAVELIRALKLWENRNGVPNQLVRALSYAHHGDAASYPAYRLFPRKPPPQPFKVELGERGSRGDWDGTRPAWED